MTVLVEHLRLASALVHTAPDADLEISGPAGPWIVSYRRSDATVDPCGFRRLVLALMRGCLTGLLPAENLRLVGAVQPCPNGTFVRAGERGEERRAVTFLSPRDVRQILDACPWQLPEDAVHATLEADNELGVVVVRFLAADPSFERHLGELSGWAATTFQVEELLLGANA